MRKLYKKIWLFLKLRLKNKITFFMLLAAIPLSIAFILSMYFELIKGHSFCETIQVYCPKFMEASVVFEVIKIVAFSTVLIGCIYSNMNKDMLGLPYYRIIYSQFPYFKIFSILHVVATFFCLVLSVSGYSESANITLALVLFGFWYQWCVLYYIILNPKECEYFATLVWKEEVNYVKNLYSNLLRLAKTVPDKESPHYNAHIKSFSLLLTRFSNNNECDSETIKKISVIWNHIFLNQHVENNKDITEDIFKQLLILHKKQKEQESDTTSAKDWLLQIVSGYALSQLNSIVKGPDMQYADDCFKELIFKIPLFAKNLAQKVSQAQRNICNELNTFIKVIMFLYAWVNFQFGIIHLPVDIWDISDNIVVKDNYFEYFDKIVKVRFLHQDKTEEQIEDAINIAKSQL